MPRLRPHKPVAQDYLDGATVHVSRELAVPPAALWRALLDAEAWAVWLPITRVTWTSPEPFGVGTTRTVDIGKHAVHEYFFAWEDGARMAFRFDRSTLPVSAGVEDYRIIPTATGCEFHWTGRVSAMWPLGWLITRSLAAGIRKGMPELERFIQSQPGRFGA